MALVPRSSPRFDVDLRYLGLISGELRVQCKAAKENPATFDMAPLNDPSTLHH